MPFWLQSNQPPKTYRKDSQSSTSHPLPLLTSFPSRVVTFLPPLPHQSNHEPFLQAQLKSSAPLKSALPSLGPKPRGLLHSGAQSTQHAQVPGRLRHALVSANGPSQHVPRVPHGFLITVPTPSWRSAHYQKSGPGLRQGSTQARPLSVSVCYNANADDQCYRRFRLSSTLTLPHDDSCRALGAFLQLCLSFLSHDKGFS